MANDLSGALFKVDNPTEMGPKYTGKCAIAGKEWRIAAWLRKTKDGATFMSLKFSEPQAPKQAAPQTRGPDDDSIPF